jgi:hypothetical protein
VTGPDGFPRRVGVEIELQGIDIGELAALTAATLGGEVTPASAVEFDIEVPQQGDYRVEVDFALLKALARERRRAVPEGGEGLMDFAVDLLSDVSSVTVPCEIVAPPIAMDAVAGPMDALVEALREAGAKGTRHSLLYAFGVHLNVEPPDLEATTIVRYLRAFVCLYDWILDEGEVDLSRRLSPYIKPYDRDYDLLVADPDYAPDWPTLIDDYLRYNPTRDRALDMLPMFAHVDEERVRATVDDPLVKARPAFHYRLANSCVGEPGWTIARPWNRWLEIERLAHGEKELATLARAFARDRSRVLRTVDKRWVSEVREWLSGRSSV